MNSTNFNALPPKLTLIAIAAVVGLHVLTAMALVSIQPPTAVTKPPEITPSIEIQLVTLPVTVAEPDNEIKKVETIEAPKPESTPKLTEAKPAEAKPTIKPEAAVTPAVKEQTVKPKTEPAVNATTKKVGPQTQPEKVDPEPYIDQNQPNQPFSHEPMVSTSTADDQRRFLEQQQQDAAKNKARRLAQIAREGAAAIAHANAKAKAKAKAEQAAAEKAAQEKSARDAQAATDAKAKAVAANIAKEAAEKAAAAASNAPISFNASSANWASAPNFSFPERAKGSARSGDTFNLVLLLRVNKQGGIDSVSLAQSSGNPLLDREAQRQVRSGKFRPFEQNGTPVVGNVTLPISYAMP
jgi:TonB family protein